MLKFPHFPLLDSSADGTANGTGTAPVTKPEPPPAPNGYTTMVKQTFHFKKDTKKDEKGNIIKDDKGVPVAGSNFKDSKHPSIDLYLPIPNDERIIEFFADPVYAKEADLIRQAAFDVVYSVARQQVNAAREADVNATIGMANLDFDKLDWTAIANMPKSERGAWAPDDEDINAFLASYASVMPEAAQKSEAAIANHKLLFQGRFTKQKAQKEILEFFMGMLNVYNMSAPEADRVEHKDVTDWFYQRLDRWVNAEEKITMADL